MARGRRRHLGRGDAPAGARGAADHGVHLVGPQRLEHRLRGRGPARKPTTRIFLPTGAKSLEQHAGAGVGAGRVVGAVDDDERLVAEDLEAPGHPDLGEGLLAPRPGRAATSKNASAAASAAAALSPWCRPWSGRKTLVVDRRRGAQRRAGARPARAGSRRTSKSTPRSYDPLGAGGAEDGDQLGVGLAEHERAAGLDDAGLLGGHVGQRRAGVLEVVEPDVGHDRDLAVDDVGGVPPPEQADLDHHHVDGDVGEPAEGGRGRRSRSSVGSHAGQRPRGRRWPRSARRSSSSSIGSPLRVDALVDPLQVGAGVGADGQALGHEQPGERSGRSSPCRSCR